MVETAPRSFKPKNALFIFAGVFLLGFIFFMFGVAPVQFPDKSMWADQIMFFETGDIRQFDFFLAYGHPGTPLLELGYLLHTVFQLPYVRAVELALGLLTCGITACCAVLCYRLFPYSDWWLFAAMTLLLNRLSAHGTPPTMAVMPLIVLIVLVTWWLWDVPSPLEGRFSLLWGAVFGLSIATRIDATVMVGGAMWLLLCFRFGLFQMLPAVAGGLLSFYLFDPYFWFMPVQHAVDLVHKFTIHYKSSSIHSTIDAVDWLHTLLFTVISLCWMLGLAYRRRLFRIVPVKILSVYLATFLVATLVIVTSKFQDARYFYPLIMFWEVLLPLLVLETYQARCELGEGHDFRRRTVLPYAIVIFLLVAQLGSHLIL